MTTQQMIDAIRKGDRLGHKAMQEIADQLSNMEMYSESQERSFADLISRSRRIISEKDSTIASLRSEVSDLEFEIKSSDLPVSYTYIRNRLSEIANNGGAVDHD